jgi:membrane protease YdiL (CAAX protease family)
LPRLTATDNRSVEIAEESQVRVQPKLWISFLLFLVYAAIVVGIWAINDVDYETLGDTTSNVIRGIVVPIGVGAIFLAIAASWLGWWRPAVKEDAKAGPRWAVLLPIALFAYVLLGLSGIDFGSDATKVLPALAFGTALVGFSEEFLTRGLMLVGFRGSLSEAGVWFLTSLMFGLLHGVNVFFGQSVGQTAFQMGFAFLLGSAFYLVRRVTGLLVVGMVIHALWDFGTLGTDATGGKAPLVANLLLYVIVILTVVLLVKVLRAPKTTPASTTA